MKRVQCREFSVGSSVKGVEGGGLEGGEFTKGDVGRGMESDGVV